MFSELMLSKKMMRMVVMRLTLARAWGQILECLQCDYTPRCGPTSTSMTIIQIHTKYNYKTNSLIHLMKIDKQIKDEKN